MVLKLRVKRLAEIKTELFIFLMILLSTGCLLGNAGKGYLIKTCVSHYETEDIKYWKELIRWLPESWLQTRTITMSYENLFAMCSKGQRRFHKLNEWSGRHAEVKEFFIQFARSLPYAQELIFIDEIDSESYPKIDFS